ANNTCGRFSNDQLSHINGQLEIESSKNEKFWTKWLIAASVLGLAFFGRANGQTVTRQTTEQRDTGKVNPQNFPLGKIAVLPTRRKISGYVTDETNERLPGVSITVPGTTIVAQTDITGAFSLETPLSCRQLKIYFIGFATKVIDLSDYAAPGNYQIKLHQNYLTGDVVIIRRPFFKRVYYNFIRNPFRKIFK
ncbi:MAG: carboxypeptidase-like regulatory domain-containing protein, partial [Mucilaginibacter sp.]